MLAGADGFVAMETYVLRLANIITLACKQADSWLRLFATEMVVRLKLTATGLRLFATGSQS